jgi:hypothetical protein
MSWRWRSWHVSVFDPGDIVRFRDRSQDAEGTVVEIRATRPQVVGLPRRACRGPRPGAPGPRILIKAR